MTLNEDLPSDTPELAIPEELQDPEDSARVNAALAYSASQDGLEVIIAPPAWSGGWGLDRPLEIGERFQGVGYINRTDDGLFRPVVFWYGDDEVPVNQVLGNTLPVRAPLPGGQDAPGETSPDPSTTSTAQDPLETSASSDPQATSATKVASPWGVWAVFGAVFVVAVIGAFVYVRRRSRQGCAAHA